LVRDRAAKLSGHEEETAGSYLAVRYVFLRKLCLVNRRYKQEKSITRGYSVTVFVVHMH
jgi:hypothetical protein